MVHSSKIREEVDEIVRNHLPNHRMRLPPSAEVTSSNISLDAHLRSGGISLRRERADGGMHRGDADVTCSEQNESRAPPLRQRTP